jgi:hypothetical protein
VPYSESARKAMKTKLASLLLLAFCVVKPFQLLACTIFSAIDRKGNVWFGNNEDASFSFYNYINVFPKTKGVKFGYYTLSKDKPENGQNAQIAGGMNEAGLAYDFNATALYPVKDMYLKKEFPKGDKAILGYILGNFSTVEEVVSFFETYWFQFGFRSAQMHLADRYGHFALISPTGSRILKNSPFQVSTNFDICGKADSTTCWRYPIVQNILKNQPPSLEVFTDICKKTTQGRHTIYSSISNLTTGAISFYFSGDYVNSYQTTLHSLLKNGRKSYALYELIPQNPICEVYKTYQSNGVEAAYKRYNQLPLATDHKRIVLENLLEFFTTEVNEYTIYPFVTELTNTGNADLDYWLIKSAIEVQKGDPGQAKSTIETTLKTFPDRQALINSFFNRINGQFEEKANATFMLEGYPTARFVIIKSVPASSNFYPLNNLTFMHKEGEKWISKFKLADGIYNYVFIVDGKEVLSKKLKTTEIKNLLQEKKKCHQLCLGFSQETYPLHIELKVPNKEDEVYIVGNQESLFAAPLIYLKQKSAFERSIKVRVHYPAAFKFVSGAGKKEALLRAIDNKQPIVINSLSPINTFEVFEWK